MIYISLLCKVAGRRPKPLFLEQAHLKKMSSEVERVEVFEQN